MTEFKGTKGEWTTVHDDYDGYGGVVDDGGFGTCFIAQEIKQGYDEGEADAKLIAAAPDLLKAALAALTILEDVNHHKIDWVRGTVRNAIEKALK